MVRRLTTVAFAALLIAAAISACADSSEADAPREDASMQAPPPTTTDAEPDGPARDASQTSSDRICTDDQWCHSELPPEHMLVDAWGDGQGMVWAVSELGAGTGGILRWDGKGWAVHHPVDGKLAAVWGSGPLDLWAGGVHGLLHGDGATWSEVDLGEEGIAVSDIAGSTATGVWVVGRSTSAETAAARAFHRAPGSTVWERVHIEPLETHPSFERFSEVLHVWVAGNGDVWLSARPDRDYLFRLAVGASSWSLVPLPTEAARPFTFVQFVGVGATGSDIWLSGYLSKYGASYWVGKGDALNASSDWKFGRWKNGLDDEEDKIRRYAVWGLSGNDVWAAGAYARIQHWDGTTWTTARLSVDGVPIGDELRALWGRSNDDLWAVGGRSALHHVSKEEAARLEAEHAQKQKDAGP
jgi:hypothetical protein